MGRARYVIACAVALSAVRPATAQTGAELLDRGVTAYREVEYEKAAALLRGALNVRGVAALTDTVRPKAYVYLGAAEHFRGQQGNATGAFRALLAIDARYRPDTLIFPPSVTDAFEEARLETAFILIRAPSDTTIAVGDGIYVARLYASALHDITVVLTDGGGETTERLYTGPIVDSLEVRWNGTATPGTPLTGALDLRVISRTPTGGERIVRVPLTAHTVLNDTLAFPAPLSDAQLRPERQPMKLTFEPLVAGVLTGLGAALLPSLVADEGSGTSLRFALSGVLGAAGVVGFVLRSRGHAIPENVAANRAVRDAWRREVEAVRSENDRRRGQLRLRVVAGVQTVVGSDG